MNIKAELHCHTNFSDGSVSPAQCIQAAAQKGIHILAITDHNTAEGALHYWQKSVEHGVLVIPGEEVSTDRGHLLVYFVKETILPDKFENDIEQVKQQDALCFIAHPYHIPLLNSIRKKNTFRLENSHYEMINGIEVENGHNRSSANQLAIKLAGEHHLNMIAGSDAHFAFEIGNALTLMDIEEITLESVREAMKLGKTQPLARKFNEYPVYLFVGLLNKLSRKQYSFVNHQKKGFQR